MSCLVVDVVEATARRSIKNHKTWRKRIRKLNSSLRISEPWSLFNAAAIESLDQRRRQELSLLARDPVLFHSNLSMPLTSTRPLKPVPAAGDVVPFFSACFRALVCSQQKTQGVGFGKKKEYRGQKICWGFVATSTAVASSHSFTLYYAFARENDLHTDTDSAVWSL